MKPKRVALGIATYALFVSFGLSALSLSVEPIGGTLFGVAREFVYDQNVRPNYELSELDWWFVPIYYYGVDVKLATETGLVVALTAKSGVSARTGIVEDSDFQNATFTSSGQEVKTLYSQADNYLERALLAHLELGYRFAAGSEFSITPLTSVHYMDMKWTARDGYTQYPFPGPNQQPYTYGPNGTIVQGTLPAWTASLPETPLYGPSVIYRQQYFIPAVGMSLGYAPVKTIEITASIGYSPVVLAQTVDDHVMRQLTIIDTFTSGTYLKPSIDVRYVPNDRFSMRLGASYTMITGLVGTTVNQYDGSTATYPDSQYIAGPSGATKVTNGGGASFNAWDILLSFRVSM